LRIVDVVESQSEDELQRPRLSKSELDDRFHVDESAGVRERHQTEVAPRLCRTPLAGGTVRQRVHLARQLVAHDAELARALQSKRSHLRVWIVAQLIRLVDLQQQYPTDQVPGFNLLRRLCCTLNRFRTAQGRCAASHTVNNSPQIFPVAAVLHNRYRRGLPGGKVSWWSPGGSTSS